MKFRHVFEEKQHHNYSDRNYESNILENHDYSPQFLLLHKAISIGKQKWSFL